MALAILPVYCLSFLTIDQDVAPRLVHAIGPPVGMSDRNPGEWRDEGLALVSSLPFDSSFTFEQLNPNERALV